jgi:AcrR family transcriptional regulator
MELFAEHGFEAITVSDIAAATGVTERTFFRYFADKKEVLFADQGQYERGFLDALAASDATAPLALVDAALHGGGAFFDEERRPYARARQRVIDSSPALSEREAHKREGVAAALTDALVERGFAVDTATLAAQSGGAAFHLAFTGWVADGETRSFDDLLESSLARLRDLLGQ